MSRFIEVPGLGEFHVDVWREGRPSEGNWTCVVSSRADEMDPFEDVLFLVEESLEVIQEQLRKLVPFRCRGCGDV